MEIMQLICDVFGYIALVTTIIGLIPQIYKTYRTKSANDLSSVMLWNCFVCAASWLIYGTIMKDKMVAISNIVALLTSIVLIILKRKYARHN